MKNKISKQLNCSFEFESSFATTATDSFWVNANGGTCDFSWFPILKIFFTKREMMTLLKVSYMLIKSIRNIRWGFIYQNEGLNYFYKMTRCKLELENSYKHSNMIQQTSIEQTLKIMIYWALFLNNHSLSIWEKIMNISFHLLMIFSAISSQFSLDYKRILNINQIDPNLILFNTPCGIRIEK